jgi:hypothetical protein
MAKERKPDAKMDTKKMMKVYQKLATPGAPHKRLAKLEGSWTTQTRAWMEPGQPPTESTGSCEQKMLLNGCYLQQEYRGDMMGQPFTGINLIAFDNHTKKYVSTWIDSMSSGIYVFEGAADANRKTITQECRYDDPVKGPSVWRSTTRFVNDNKVEYEMYLKPKRGREEKMMEMTLTRNR